ncbi:MAG: primosomal protein N' [Candidatus Peregrinibacteria bacterium]
MKYAEVLIPQKIGEAQSTLTYSIPPDLKLKTGQSVLVPLKKRKVAGIVWDITGTKPSFKTLPVAEILSPSPLLSKNQIKIAEWLSLFYFCPLFKILKLFIPKKILEGKKIRKTAKTTEQIIRTKTLKLTEEQEKTVATILSQKKNKFLVHGVTGSGKTEIYSRLAKSFIEKGKQVLILVPEISLTPQMIEYFEKSIGIRSSVIHSKLSEGERINSWKNILSGSAKLIIGSRSSIFAPFQNLGLIIIDEEHELSYKQDNSPRYETHRVAEKIQEFSPEIKIVWGSATPSIETAETLKDSTLMIKERIGRAALPEIEIVDLRDEFKKGNYSIFSDRLKEEITLSLKNKSQTILFLNRRGSASSVICRDCGFTEKCDACELPLTYHAKTLGSPSLICHHCGKIQSPPVICRNCKSPNIKFLGIGTQRIEAELLKEFPDARVLRADKDTTSGKHAFKEIYETFREHKADILIGTQMIAKGLHLPKVSLVGIILADIGLNIPDFRTTERNFQLMTQVAGRAGRSNSKGKVIIQTYNPQNTALLFAASNDYENFFKYERTQRKLMNNPPFGKIAKITIESESFSNSGKKAETIETLLKNLAKELNPTENLEILSYPAHIMRLRGKYRHIVLLKTTHDSIIHKILEKLPKKYIMDANAKIDINPISTT